MYAIRCWRWTASVSPRTSDDTIYTRRAKKGHTKIKKSVLAGIPVSHSSLWDYLRMRPVFAPVYECTTCVAAYTFRFSATIARNQRRRAAHYSNRIFEAGKFQAA